MSLRGLLDRLFMRPRTVRQETMFGTARIYERYWGERTIRVLDLNGTMQSATYLDDGWCDLPFLYMRLYNCLFEARPQTSNLLMLGGGGFAYPKHVIAHRPNARIDVVEIDPAITRIAYEHFFLDRLMQEWHTEATGRLKIYETDALTYLQSCIGKGKRYDAILNDCFALDVADTSLFEADALRIVDSCLVPGGLYMVNIISALQGELAEPFFQLVDGLVRVFSHVYAIPCYREPNDQRDNIIVVASQQSAQISSAFAIYEAVD